MDRIRSGIIGTGFIGGVHAAAVRAAGGVVQAVASATPEGAQNAAAAWHAEHTANSGLDLIARDDIDVVHICTPNATHAELAHAAMPPARPSSARNRWRSIPTAQPVWLIRPPQRVW